MIAQSNRWQRTALAMASATLLGLWGSQAAALSLGRVMVQSALGEPLRAEIEILDINAEEASSLRTGVAMPDAFRAAGLEYSATLNGTQISLQKRGDGSSYLRLTNNRPVNDPYLDLVLEASWSSGRIVRDYTLLFDPPKLGAAQPAASPQAPQVSSVPVRVAEPPAPAAPAPVVSPATPAVNEPPMPAPPAEAPPAASSEPPAPQPAPAPTPEPVAASPAAAESQPAAEAAPAAAETAPAPAATATPTAASEPVRKRLTVKSGDTAGRIALSNKPTGISLDQMLVAMLRSNPEAFIDGNVNRIRAGAVVNLPGSDDAEATSAEEARQIMVAQSRDFNEFRRQLAASAPASKEAVADRKSAGTVEAKVEEKKTTAAAPDKLTLSKGSVDAKAAEDKIAKERADKEAAARAEALAKNIAELDKLSKAASEAPKQPPAVASAPAAAPAAPPPQPAPALSVPASPPPAAKAPEAPKPPPVAAPAPAAKPAAPKPAAPVAPPVVEEPSMLDELLENPMVPAAAGGLIALLAGLAFYRSRQRKAATQVDSAYLESRLQPDSFFGASGGQQVDTNDAGASSSSSSMVYSPSQLDAGDDVDPVAEADVYLAYGRDLQAEEILKEALRNHPSRVAVHQKLLEIYAKRRDTKNFGAIAKEAHNVTGGSGAEWEQIAEMGRSIDPGNEMYNGGEPQMSAPAPLQSAPIFNEAPTAATAPAPVAATPPPAMAAAGAGGVDLDLDLDFSLDEAPARSASAPSAPTMPAPIAAAADNSMEFEAPSLPPISAQPAPAPAASDGMMNFDMGALSLDLGSPSEQPAASAEDPLSTKLALADEFKAIGDTDGARALIEEIIAEASGDMKARAQKALAALG